ncbi:MAG TPA: exonuclease domain-containing protein, partial [Sulfuricurvum sp.]|nr:exonuclease domain-containing protein [Sulfuricurvum sp.]
MKLDPKLFLRLIKKGIPKEEFESLLPQPSSLSLELLSAQGLNLVLKDDLYCLSTSYTPVADTLFCIVDVETNGSKPSQHQIIEIGAVKLQNGVIIDTYDSLVYATDISKQ